MKEIVLGALICEKIKEIYFKNQSWQASYQDVSIKFGTFKKIMQKIYTNDKIIDILDNIKHFNIADVQEIFSMQEDYLKEEQPQADKTKYGNDVVWVPVPIEKVDKVKQVLHGT